MTLIGRRTYIVCIVIAALAAVQKFFSVQIPQEVWIALFALAVAATRSAVGAAKLLALLLIPAALLCGCAGPNPMQFKLNLLTVYAPRVNVATQPAVSTNAVASASVARGQSDQNTQTIQPSQRGVCILLDDLFAFPVGSGTATSNTVPVSFSFNKE